MAHLVKIVALVEALQHLAVCQRLEVAELFIQQQVVSAQAGTSIALAQQQAFRETLPQQLIKDMEAPVALLFLAGVV
jgi:hypothetical protein